MAWPATVAKIVASSTKTGQNTGSTRKMKTPYEHIMPEQVHVA